MSRDVTNLMPEMIDPVEGHPDTCDCIRKDDGEIVWTDPCLEDAFVEWQKSEIEARPDPDTEYDWFEG